MGLDFFYPEFEVIRNESRCIACRVCVVQCANEVHSYDPERGVMAIDETKCVNCQRCVSFCPTRALKIVKSDCALRENANWQKRYDPGNLQAGLQRRRAALIHGKSQAAPGVLGQNTD
jgi:NAD-dependent dihydropyrimidine dehydrogenase PreA subunit